MIHWDSNKSKRKRLPMLISNGYMKRSKRFRPKEPLSQAIWKSRRNWFRKLRRIWSVSTTMIRTKSKTWGIRYLTPLCSNLHPMNLTLIRSWNPLKLEMTSSFRIELKKPITCSWMRSNSIANLRKTTRAKSNCLPRKRKKPKNVTSHPETS